MRPNGSPNTVAASSNVTPCLARLAEKLLESLETLSAQENERLWAEEAERRDADWESAAGTARPAADVLRDVRAKLNEWVDPNFIGLPSAN